MAAPARNPDAPASPTVKKDAHEWSRAALEGVLAKRFFYNQAFEIYGGVAGLYDYGPTGAALQANIIAAWRNHFILEEEMLELDTTIMTLSDVLKTSGHVDKFADFMCKDLKNGEIFRADHLVEGVLEARLKGDEQAREAEAGTTSKPKEEVAAEGSEDKKTAKKKKIKSAAVKLDDAVKAEYESVLAQIDNYTGAELGQLIKKFAIKSPETGNELSEPVEFNLMFETQIGPTGYVKGYLRPETAQGHFVNFARLLDFNNGRVPFASAHIGKSFRNEISPRAGLLRVREFVMAEIEHYVDPLDKNHERFDEVKQVKLPFLPKGIQQSGKTDITTTTIGEAVASGMVDNQTLGYFLARIYLFLQKIGIDTQRVRFRQHMANEMAHYASDCWDAEIKTSYGWVECVGCADRSAYDLTVHSKRTHKELHVQVPLKEPKVYDKLIPELNRKALGPKFKKEAKAVEEAIVEMDQDALGSLQSQLQNGSAKVKVGSQEYEITPDLVKVELKVVKETVRTYTPNVIEPSFGIGRIFYSLLEHSFWAREEDADRGVLSLPPLVAPFKALIVPISNSKELAPLVKQVSRKLRSAGVAARVDDSSATIGRRYARNDELGTPFACTLDFASLSKGTMTLRERDTTSQLIGPIDEVISVIRTLCDGEIDWQGAQKRLPAYSGQQALD
ncbi:putative glycine--tRNA ligase GRS1 [Tilletiaria anomala UBC 951]|uniref:glycine--tRNA ligase n=1 Tax=Tilletiaria anomala (strain ATCC 24038 / CBS 436.72 / UBC 951) TaxID=1037660 RepID=A0A066WEW9_TILAU|nr:putative glycine--tRNA ligase GRS1 [Tilletiaria anomala UBC 951]KDN52497.1 putative glycine--tRNA ligase GRS1 [Tilletiaria anomala UBC 951]